MNRLEAFVNLLLKDLSHLPEEKMKKGLLQKRLKRVTPEDLARLLDILYNLGQKDDLARKAQSLLVRPEVLEEVLGTEKFRLTYLASLDLGLKRVSRLFTNLPPHRTGLHGYDKEEEARMEFLTLGERRSLARGFEKTSLDRLLSDPDIVVISNLLDNPRLTEREVLKIASKRPGSPKILGLLVGHRKWSKRYAVMKAVAQNPYTPPRISVGLLELLLSQDLRKIARDRTLHPQVKASAKDILEDRGVEV